MSRITFENYGRAARNNSDLTFVSGRYLEQKSAECLIVSDVVSKLALKPEDKLLEVGCGPGNLLIPLSFMVCEATGIDHPDVCALLKQRFNSDQVKTIGINFLDYEGPAHSFDKVLIYSVINTLTNEEEAYVFLDKALKLLAPGGILLIGDIANVDTKRRFLASAEGKKFQKAWEAQIIDGMKDSFENISPYEEQPDNEMFQPDDAFIIGALSRYRNLGTQTYLLSQPKDLPFGRTREDIIIKAPR